jgi:DNA-binding response OmpR family regulator
MPMLIVDDNRRYAEALFRDAQRHGILLRHAASLQEARELFEGPEGGSLTGIILDVKCCKEKHQGVPDNSFIVAAVRSTG